MKWEPMDSTFRRDADLAGCHAMQCHAMQCTPTDGRIRSLHEWTRSSDLRMVERTFAQSVE